MVFLRVSCSNVSLIIVLNVAAISAFVSVVAQSTDYTEGSLEAANDSAVVGFAVSRSM